VPLTRTHGQTARHFYFAARPDKSGSRT